jgi:hypothetical protein
MAIQDMTGQTFGKLTVLRLVKPRGGKSFWLCLCECGQTRDCSGAVLRQRRVSACRPCSVARMLSKLRKSPAVNRPRLHDPDAMAAALDDEGRRKYERWESSCRKLSVEVSKFERVEVLRELVGARAA